MFLDAVPRALRALDPVDDSAVHHQPRDRRARQRADPLPVVQVSDGQIVDQLTHCVHVQVPLPPHLQQRAADQPLRGGPRHALPRPGLLHQPAPRGALPRGDRGQGGAVV